MNGFFCPEWCDCPAPPPLSADATESDRIVQQFSFDPKLRFKHLLEDGNGWYGIEEIAEKVPQEFLAQIWPLFVQAVSHVLLPSGADRTQFRQDYCLGLEFSAKDGPRDYPLPTSIDIAVRTLARNYPHDFVKLLESERAHDSETVQRLLARGLVEMAARENELVLRFLLEDDRRFELGPNSDQHEDTIRLMQAIAPHLSDEQFGDLQSAIEKWSLIRAQVTERDVESRFHAQKYNRRRRLRLLASLPRDRLSPTALALIRQEEGVFPDHEEAGVSRIEGGFVGSPMTAEQMQRAKNSDIVNLFRRLPDRTGSSHQRNWLRGGSAQASSEFERFATASPDRAVAILADFEPSKQERPAGAGLVGLSKSDFADEALFKLIFDLDTRGFRSEEFRISAARALETRLKQGEGLPDRVCELLERWLSDPWYTKAIPRVEQETKEEKPTSVLWQRSTYPISYGTYNLLHTVTYGYLLRKTPAAGKWLAALEAHCERPEQTETWLANARNLHYLHLCDHGRASCFLANLFERYPGLLASEEGAVLLTHVWSFVPAESLWEWLVTLRNGTWNRGAQAFGELLGLRALNFPDDKRASKEIDTALLGDPEPRTELHAVRTGIAFACANLWGRAGARRAATELLVRLISVADADVGSAVMHLFVASDSLLPDNATHQILNALVKNPRVLMCAAEGWFIERLEALLPNEPELVYQLCREVVRLRGQELGTEQRSWSMHSANLTNVALTLHRLDRPFREKGLELFEALLDVRLPDAEAALRELDLRPPGNGIGFMPRRHRQRRRRQRATSD